jgi:uncharacterized membrane protein
VFTKFLAINNIRILWSLFTKPGTQISFDQQIQKTINATMKTKLKVITLLKWTAVCCTGLLIGLVLFIRFSPYKKLPGHNKCGIKHAIVINNTAENVYEFLCNQPEEKKWMNYTDHIDLVSKQADSLSEIGNIFRHYSNNDETGQMYDSKVLKIEKNKRRVIRLNHFTDFPMSFNEIITEQQFRTLPENKCELSMTLFYENTKPDFWDEVKAYLASYRIKKAIRENMENLKKEMEKQIPYTKF